MRFSYSEQFFLLTIDPVTGKPFPVNDQVMHLTLAGALLFDASFKGMINDDWENVTVLKTSETRHPALDETLRCMQVPEQSVPLEKALELVAAHGSTLRRMVSDFLQSRRVLTRKKKEIIQRAWKNELFSPDMPVVTEIHRKIRHAILKDEIPDFQIPALVSLVVAGGLIKYILNPDEASRFSEKIDWLASMESLGRAVIRSVRSLESSDLEKDAAKLVGLKYSEPKTIAGGMDAVLSSLSYLYKEVGIRKSRKLLTGFNQLKGFECPGCAWPNPDKGRSHFEFCENGAKSLSAEATSKTITAAFFKKWSLNDLLRTQGYWLEQQGRLTSPMLRNVNEQHYKPISWNDAFNLIASELKALTHPDEAVFYASGKSSIEAAYLYQLLARTLGTNNLPSSANLCHEPSGKAIAMSLGYGKSSVTLDDFPKADAIFLFGHNPGSNHPRMLKSLQSATRKGCRIVAVNPLPEASLMGFADPQDPGSYMGIQTRLAHLYIQPVINGDMALIRGMVKATLEEEDLHGKILDTGFIQKYCSGFEQYKQLVLHTSWESLVAASGVEKVQITEAARIYFTSGNVIASWCLGIAHHLNATETIRELINLLLLRGNIGKPGAGVCPVRGHSNIQGIRTSGIGTNMPVSFFESLEKHFPIRIPRTAGMSVIPAIKSMAEGKIKVLISLGGNLASAVPDTSFTEEALQRCGLTVMISTKLNRSHLVCGRKALILPCLSRSEEDIVHGNKQFVTIEDTMGKVSFSGGCLPPASPDLKSEVSIISGIARATFGDHSGIEWQKFPNDYQHIRSTIAETIPAFADLGKHKSSMHGFYLENPLRKRIFNTPGGKAQFGVSPLEMVVPGANELVLMTIRSHDQFNTSVFGLNDRYRGVSNERRVLFMNRKDMEERNIFPEQQVNIESHYDEKVRKLEGYYVIPYPISKGCVAAYFPEANWLLSINNTARECETPAYKSVKVLVF